MQIKTTRYHYTLIRMAKVQNIDNTKYWWGCRATGTLIYCWWECKMVQPLWKPLTIWSSNQIPWYLFKWVKHKTWTRMFMAPLFKIAQTWKQPRCPSVGEWIKKMWYIQTMECHSVVNRNELSSREKTWRKLKCILLSERSQSEKLHTVWFQLYDILKKAKLWRQYRCQGLVGMEGWIGRAERTFRQWKYSVWY